MIIYNKIIIFFIILIFSVNNISAKYIVEPKIEKLISNFIIKIDKKYSSNIDKQILFLEKINSKINNILEKKKINSKNKKILNDIMILFNEEIFKLKGNKDKNNTEQKLLEKNILNNLKQTLSKINAEYTSIQIWKKIYKVTENIEFIENNEIKKIIFNKYFKIDTKNYKQFKSKKWIILVFANWKNWFVEDYNIEKKIPYSNWKTVFKNFITHSNKYILENNIFYSYNFKNFNFIKNTYWFYKSELENNNINPSTSILYLSKNNKYNFITDYKKTKLINSDIIFWITDKDIFLKNLINDKLYLTWDTDKLFEELKEEIKNITNKNTLWKAMKKEEKIKIIYNFILKNIEYTQNLDLEDKKIFSGILTYKNKNGVCEWYVKLMSYSLKFAWIKDAEVIRWDVIDALDFPEIWHAWLKIWDLYYDPTFDDPTWINTTKTFSEYKYFWLPKDLLYVNRFDYWTTPEYLKFKSLDYRKNFVNKNLEKIYKKYFSKNYLILKPVFFNKKYNIPIWKNITIKEIKKIIPFYEVTEKNNWEIFFYKNSNKKNIKKLQYFLVTDKNIKQILAQLDYKTEGLYLFNWKLKNWKNEYRIGFDVVIK